MRSALVMVREEAARYARGLGDFSGVEILTLSQGDPANRAQIALGKTGATIIIDVPRATAGENQSMSIVTLEPIEVVMECATNVVVNDGPGGTRKSADYLAERCVANFQIWTPPMPPEFSPSPFVPGIVERLPFVKEFPNMLIFRAHFETRCRIPSRTP